MVGTCQDVTGRRRAEAALARHTYRLECLRAIDLAILSSRSPREVAEAALANLTRMVNYWTASVCVFDLDREEVEVIADAGILREWYPPGSRIRVPLKGRSEIDALREGRAWSEDDVAGASLASPVLEALRAAGMRSYVLMPLLDNGPLAGSLFLGSDRPAAFSPEQIQVAREVADQLAIALRQAQLFEEVEAARVRLADLSRRLIRAQEDERHHIARELHDEIGQSLTAIKIHLQGGREGRPRQGRGSAKHRPGRAALGQIRGISLDLRPSMLDDFGLVATLRWYIDHQPRIAGFGAGFNVGAGRRRDPPGSRDRDRRLPGGAGGADEHSPACRPAGRGRAASDRRRPRARRPRRRGRDSIWRRNAAGRRGPGLGLVGMRERSSILGGRIAIRSLPGRGTGSRPGSPCGNPRRIGEP